MRLSDAVPAGRARELAKENHFLTLCRVGFLARGLLYMMVALLALQTGRTEDLTGALGRLASGSGRLLLVVVAAGLATYGLWRLADAAFGIEHRGSDREAIVKRAGAGLSGAIHLYLSYKAVRIVVAGESAAKNEQQTADWLLDLAGGSIVLALVAAGLAIAGIAQLLNASRCNFLHNLDHRATAPAVKWLGRIGYAARGVIFLTVAFLIGRAALDGRSAEVAGMEQALDFFSGPVLYAVALGLMLFGAFSIIEGLFRRLQEPPGADEMKRQIRNKVQV